jgi:hypothetical protein
MIISVHQGVLVTAGVSLGLVRMATAIRAYYNG